MKKKIILFLFISLFSYCSQELDAILEKKEFVNLLVEIHTADAILTEMKLNDKKIKNNDSLSYYNFIFKKYGINRNDFDRNIDYYWNNPKKYQEVYVDVLKILDEKRELIDTLAKNDKSELFEVIDTLSKNDKGEKIEKNDSSERIKKNNKIEKIKKMKREK